MFVPERSRPRHRRRAIATRKKRKPLPSKRPPARRRPARRARPAPPPIRLPGEQPLGVGVGDAYAAARLGIPPGSRAKKKPVREIPWAAFGEMSRQLAARIGQTFQPDLILGIVKGGVHVGGALAGSLACDFVPVRVERRSRDVEPLPEVVAKLPPLKGRRVLVVDDVANTGGTLAKGRALARKAGARDVRTAALVVRPQGFRPDWHALETSALVLFGWDYQIHAMGPVDPGDVGV